MAHYNYCGICNGITLHEYQMSGGIRWEHCECQLHEVAMSEVLAKLSTIVNGKVKQNA